MKKVLSVLMAIAVVITTAFAFGGCNSSSANGKVYKIGIVQIMEHPSLDTIRESFIAELNTLGYQDGKNITIDYQNAQGDQSNLKSITQKFVGGNYDMIVAIATPSALAAKSETSTIPIIFAACTDPVGTGIVADADKPGGNITGTSDAVSVDKIMELAKKITPNIKTIGALYNAGEANSLSVIANLKAYAAQNGLTVVEKTVSTAADVQQAAASLTQSVDAIFTPIDNTVASAMPVVADVANSAKIPVYVSADSMVKDGGLATYGVNYETLGHETAKMAADVLNGKNPGDIPVRTMSDMKAYINSDTASKIGVTIPSDILSQATDLKQ